MEKENPAIFNSTVVRVKETGELRTSPDKLAVEEPLEIRIGNKPFIVTMRTPGQDEELAAGFLVSEGIVRNPREIQSLSRCPASPRPENTLRVDLNKDAQSRIPQAKRYGSVEASCGICGKTSIDTIRIHFPRIESTAHIQGQLLLELPERLRKAQSIFEETGGLHSAGLFDLEGKLICQHEDVGRHNAVDKVIGYALIHKLWPLDRHVLMVSGRVAFEIMQKALAARIAIVAAVSAPSSLAVQSALKNGQTLVGFLRPPTFNIYAHPQRITP